MTATASLVHRHPQAYFRLMNRDEILRITIGDLRFDGVRVADEGFPHFIELRQPGSAELFARVNYHGPGGGMDVVTGGQPVPRAVVEWLLERADSVVI